MELIVLQHQLEHEPGNAVIAGRIETMLKKHKWAPKPNLGLYRLEWRWGFIRKIRTYHIYDSSDLDVLRPTLALPLSSLLEECVMFTRSKHSTAEQEAKANIALYLPKRCKLKTVGQTAIAAKTKSTKAAWGRMVGPIPESLIGNNLVYLDCQGVATLPESVGNLPLQYLSVSWCSQLKHIPNVVWGIESLGYISMYDTAIKLNMGQVNAMLSGFVRSQASSKQRIFEASLLQGILPSAAAIDYLRALDSNVKIIHRQALLGLNEVLPNLLTSNAIRERSVVVVVGSLNLSKKALKSRVEGWGGTFATKMSGKTTHVIIGESPKGKQIDLDQVVVVLERHLTSDSGSTSVNVSIAECQKELRSKDDSRITGVVQTLQEAASIPVELLSELFCVLQDTSLGTSRKLAKKLFAAYAPAKLQEVMVKHYKASPSNLISRLLKRFARRLSIGH